jgi:hypothetical protein
MVINLIVMSSTLVLSIQEERHFSVFLCVLWIHQIETRHCKRLSRQNEWEYAIALTNSFCVGKDNIKKYLLDMKYNIWRWVTGKCVHIFNHDMIYLCIGMALNCHAVLLTPGQHYTKQRNAGGWLLLCTFVWHVVIGNPIYVYYSGFVIIDIIRSLVPLVASSPCEEPIVVFYFPNTYY